MAGVRTTQNALLGLLAICPMSGYDIRQLIPWSIGHFWSESYGQISPGLKRLVAEELAVKTVVTQEGKPDRHVYTLTAEGRSRLAQWLELPVEQFPPRSELLLKLFFGAHESVEAMREHVVTCERQHRSALAVYEATVQRLEREHGADPQLPFWLMTVSYGKHQSRAIVDWCNETMRQLGSVERKRQKTDKEEAQQEECHA